MNLECSIVTIVKGRIRQLANLIRSLEQMNYYPSEMIVVWMAPPCSESLLTSDHFDIHHKFIANDPLPIARARNKGFFACSTQKIVYLDVDCICPPDLIHNMVRALHRKRVVTTQVMYLNDVPDHINYSTLKAEALPAPQGDVLSVNRPLSFTHFKTMIFAITKTDFTLAGEFDEDFSGYGVGDIDFATRCEQAGMTLHIISDIVLHQYHPKFEPPVNHLFDIVHNATRYKQKWGHYPLQEYLDQFAEEGLINQDYAASGLRIRRIPTDQEIRAHLSTKPY